MKRIVFVGGLIDRKNLSTFIKKSTCSSSLAQENYFLRIIDSFSLKGYSTYSISSPFLGKYGKQTFLKYNNCFENLDGFYYGKCPTPRFQRLLKLKKSLIEAFSTLKKAENISYDDEIYFFVIQPNYFYLKAAFELSKKYKKSKVILFIQDLPQFTHSEKASGIIKFLKKIESVFSKKYLYMCNGFVLFSSLMEAKLKLNKPCITIETVVPNNYLELKRNNSIKNSVAYTGSLNEKYGIKGFIDSFNKNNFGMTLYIAGDGDCAEYIKQLNAPNIDYLGTLSIEECANLQKRVSVVVNPRENKEEYTKYSYPSKTTEYLLNNGLVACFKLDGIPKEYDTILHYPENQSFDSLVKLCRKLCDVSDEAFSELIKERNKIFSNKTSLSQVDAIINLLTKME